MKKVVFLFNEKDDGIPSEFSAAITWWYGILENFGYEVMYYDYARFNFDAFYNEVKDYKPDFIIHACYGQLHTEFVKLRQIAKTFVMQSDDDYRFHNFARFWIPIVDGVISFCGEREEMKKLYYSHGATDKTFLHGYWSFNPNTMMLDQYPPRTRMLTHMGSVYGNRPQIIGEFERGGIKADVHTRVTYEDFKKLTAQSKFTLCLTMAAPQNMRQLKGRLFELPNLSILVSEPFPNMETYYDLDKEIIIFNSVPEAIEKINKLTNPLDYDTFYNAGKKRLLAEHTCYHVWDKYILPKMDDDYKPCNVAKILKENHNIVI
jgi:hypothetical protein